MTGEDAIAIAKQIAEKNHWQWSGPGIARKGGWFTRIVYAWGKPVWEVYSHNGKGCLVHVIIEDSTSRILCAGFMPR